MRTPILYQTLLHLLILLLSLTTSIQSMARGDERYLVTNAAGSTLSYVDLKQGVTDQVKVGIAPFDLALDQQGKAYVATAEGVAIVDIENHQRTAMIPYRADVGRAGYGEYRNGGMGIDVSPDGNRVYVGVYLGHKPSRVEIIDSIKQRVIDSVEVGIRPFQVLLGPDGKQLYSIDHDSYAVTAINLSDLKTNTLTVAPLGYGGFDKPHYAVLDKDGKLLLPVQGKVLASLDPKSGQITTTPLSADTHQHGITLSKDKSTAYIVGTGPAGGANSAPSLSIVDLTSGTERLIPLSREHEQVVLNQNETHAILSGGNSFTHGWNGITIIDLSSGDKRYIDVPDQPLGIRAVNQ